MQLCAGQGFGLTFFAKPVGYTFKTHRELTDVILAAATILLFLTNVLHRMTVSKATTNTARSGHSRRTTLQGSSSGSLQHRQSATETFLVTNKIIIPSKRDKSKMILRSNIIIQVRSNDDVICERFVQFHAVPFLATWSCMSSVSRTRNRNDSRNESFMSSICFI